MTGGPNVPRSEPRALVEIHGDDLPGRREDRLVATVEVEIGEQGDGLGREGAVREVLRSDQLGQGGHSEMRHVDPAEQAVPVRVVGLPAVQVTERRREIVAGRHRCDLPRRPEHLLVEVVDLAVLHLEVPPRRAPQPARLR